MSSSTDLFCRLLPLALTTWPLLRLTGPVRADRVAAPDMRVSMCRRARWLSLPRHGLLPAFHHCIPWRHQAYIGCLTRLVLSSSCRHSARPQVHHRWRTRAGRWSAFVLIEQIDSEGPQPSRDKDLRHRRSSRGKDTPTAKRLHAGGSRTKEGRWARFLAYMYCAVEFLGCALASPSSKLRANSPWTLVFRRA